MKTNSFSNANHVGIVVSDLAAAVNFYQALSGCPVHFDQLKGAAIAHKMGASRDFEIKIALVYLANLNIELLEYVSPKAGKVSYDNNQISAMHLCFEVTDFDEAIGRLKAIGVEPLGAPVKFDKEDGLKSGISTRLAFFKDPDGTNLEIMAPQESFLRKSDV